MATLAARLFPMFDQLVRGRRSETGPILLDRRRIYILPTRHGVTFGFFLLAMLIGSINYGLSLGYVLTFLLGGVSLVGILHTYKNLEGIKVSQAGSTPAFAREQATFHFEFEAPGRHLALTLAKDGTAPVRFDVDRIQRASIHVAAARRGRLLPGRFTLSTVFPLGLYRAWSYLQFDHAAIVYPMPGGTSLDVAGMGETGSAQRASQREGSEDFAGLRSWQPGDSPRQVAWKVAARSEVLSTKRFSDVEGGSIMLDWEKLAGMDTEARLSQLTRWVLEAEQMNCRYALNIPGTSIQAGNGLPHQRRCLEALALFGLPEHD